MSKLSLLVVGAVAASVLWIVGLVMFGPKRKPPPEPVVISIVETLPGGTTTITHEVESKSLTADRDRWRKEAETRYTLLERLQYSFDSLRGQVGILTDTEDIAYAESSWSLKRIAYDRGREVLTYAAFKSPDNWMVRTIHPNRLWSLSCSPATVRVKDNWRHFDVGLVAGLRGVSVVEARAPHVAGNVAAGVRFRFLEVLIGWSQPLYGPESNAGICAEVRWQVWR
jgi:hypothetical protein